MRKIPEHILNKLKSFLNKAFRLSSKVETLDGFINVYKVFPNGERELVVSDPNLIVLASKEYMLSSIYKSPFTQKLINRLQVGTGGTVDPGGLYPKSVSQTLTSLFTPLLSVSTYYTEDVTIPSVTFIADVDQATGNGSLITEAGLLFADGTLFNIKTFPGIPKTADFSVHFEWTVKVA